MDHGAKKEVSDGIEAFMELMEAVRVQTGVAARAAHPALFPGTEIGSLRVSAPYMLGRNLMSTDQMLHFDFIGGTYSRLSLVYALHRQAHTQVFPNSCDPQFWPEGSFQFHGEAMEVTTEGPMGHRAVNPTVPTLYVVQPELETGSMMAMFADRTLHCGKRPSPDSFSGQDMSWAVYNAVSFKSTLTANPSDTIDLEPHIQLLGLLFQSTMVCNPTHPTNFLYIGLCACSQRP